MADNSSSNWRKRKIWRIVVLPCIGAILLAGVSVFRGWLHQRAGFDAEGHTLSRDRIPPLRPPVVTADTYTRIVEDLQRRDEEARPRLRYLTLTHKHNEPTCSDADLEANRRAVRELMALLWQGQSSRLDFIDPEQVILRLDLENLGWAAETEWHQVVSHYRYGLKAEGDGPLARVRRQAEELTQASVPVVRADWFVVALTRPPLSGSKGLLQVPPNDLPESIRVLDREYAAETLDLVGCARELDLAEPTVLADLIRQHENLQQEFGLAPLLRDQRIRREWWESDRHLFSPYQELARQLGIGKPVRVQ